MPEAALELGDAIYPQPALARTHARRPADSTNRHLATAAAARPTRIVLYSHDTLGLGHTRRNLLIAQTLAEAAGPCSILLISGAFESRNFVVPEGVDYLSLPALSKDGEGSYRARRLGCSLDEIVALRSETIRGAMRAFKPDVLIVDNVPHGAQGELIPVLSELRQRGATRCILGLRDILDDPAAIRAEWARAGASYLLRNVYDAIWIYGDRRVYNPMEHYDFLAPFTSKVRFSGYLDQRARRHDPSPALAELIAGIDARGKRLALCTVGGGQDGAAVAGAFASASFPEDMEGVLLSGPFMPAADMRHLIRIAASRPDLTLLDFVPEPAPLLRRADRVISMGGYNTTCELLSYGKSALIVPRVRPRREQWLRATRLQEMGALDALHPDQLSPSAIGDWLSRDVAHSRRHDIDIDGLTRLPLFLEELRPASPLMART